jgi:NAD(P)-dependent dehydrogenase (short-subunit alcohol dehydrogenase family)
MPILRLVSYLMAPITGILDEVLKGGSGANFMNVYSASKFVQLLGAHWWRRELAGQCDVVACSPGLIPGTGLGRNSGLKLTMDMADAKPVATGKLFTY